MFKSKSIGIRLLVVSLAALMVSTTVLASPPGGPSQPDFGPNVFIFDPGMPLSQIQAQVDLIKNQMVDNEMGSQRYALLFRPGTYGSAATPSSSRWATIPR